MMPGFVFNFFCLSCELSILNQYVAGMTALQKLQCKAIVIGNKVDASSLSKELSKAEASNWVLTLFYAPFVLFYQRLYALF